MAPDESKIPLPAHPLFALSTDKAVAADGVEAASAILEMVELTKGFLKDVRDGRVAFPDSPVQGQSPSPLPEARALLEKRRADMDSLWVAADRLPETLQEIQWFPEKGTSATVQVETARRRIRHLWVRIQDYLERHAYCRKQNAVDAFTAAPHDQHAHWGILDQMDGVVRTKYVVELVARPALAKEPDCSDLKERWRKTLRPGRGKLKFAARERQRILDEMIDRFRAAGQPVPTQREAAELVGASATAVFEFWSVARDRLRYE